MIGDGLSQSDNNPADVPAANLLGNNPSVDVVAQLSDIAKQNQSLEVQVKQTLQDVEKLKSESKKLNESARETQDSTKNLQSSIKSTNNLVVVGMYVLIAMVAALVIAVVVYEIQTMNQNNQQIIEMLKELKK